MAPQPKPKPKSVDRKEDQKLARLEQERGKQPVENAGQIPLEQARLEEERAYRAALEQARSKQKEERAKKLALDDRQKLLVELGEVHRPAAALFKFHLDCQLEEQYASLEDCIREWEDANQSLKETIPQDLRKATLKDLEDTLRRRLEEIGGVNPPESQNRRCSPGPSSSSNLSQLREDQLPPVDSENRPLLPRSDELRTYSLREEDQNLEDRKKELQELIDKVDKRKQFENKLWEEAFEIEKRKRDLLGTWKVSESLEAEIHLQHLLKVLDKKELDEVYKCRIKDDRGIIEARDKAIFKEQRETAEDDIRYVDNKRGIPELPESYKEIKRLLDIENSPVYVKALQEWSRKEVLLSNRVECKKQIVANLKNEIYQLIGFFSVFQGVVLTAVAQSSLLRCHNLWSPICLSVLASGASISGVVQKLKQIKDFQTTIDTEDHTLKIAVARGERLRRLGPEEFSFATSVTETGHKAGKGIILRWIYYFLVTVTLVAFGVLFPVSQWRILCYPDSPAPVPAPAPWRRPGGFF